MKVDGPRVAIVCWFYIKMITKAREAIGMPTYKADNHSQAGKGRVIIHLDMNAFYCSVHEAEEPHLYKGKPTAVAGSVELRKGIIVTSSYAARRRASKPE